MLKCFLFQKNHCKRKSIEENKAAVIVAYVQNKYRCRSSFLLDYFGEENHVRCGICDVCLERNKLDITIQNSKK